MTIDEFLEKMCWDIDYLLGYIYYNDYILGDDYFDDPRLLQEVNNDRITDEELMRQSEIDFY